MTTATKTFDTLTKLPMTGLTMAMAGFDMWLAAADRADDLTRTWLDMSRQWRHDLADMAKASLPTHSDSQKA
jgi:hypothetical protein